MRKVRVLGAGAALVAATVLVLGPSGAVGTPDVPTNGGDPDGYVVGQSPYSTVYEPPPGVIAGNPSVDTFDEVDQAGLPRKRAQLFWGSNEDVASAASVASMVNSYDGGHTFPSGVNQTAGAGWFTKLRDGSILGVEFIPDSVIDEHSLKLVTRRSTDGGKTYRRELATFTTDKTLDPTKFDRGIRVHRDLFYAKDGSLLLTYYTRYPGDPLFRSELARSTDNGRTWTRFATIATQTDNRSMGETGVARAANGDLVAVHRTALGASSTTDWLYTNRSGDDGRTWTTPKPVEVTTATGEARPPTGIMPVLRLLPNGIMTMTWGRPDNWIAISPDGLGARWEQAQLTYVNYPRVNQAFQRSHGSSGNGAHAAVGSNRVLVVGDNCAPSWGCPETDAGFHTDGNYRVWKKFVDVVGPGTGKIDLLGKHIKKKVAVQTTMDARAPRLPEMSPLGAVDGSTEWASAAVGRQRTGTYTVTLDRTYSLTKAGLSLRPGEPAEATIEASVDGTTWRPVVTTGEITTYALRYYDVARVPAKYVRVTVTDRQAAYLNELELYSSVDSFENDPVGQVPRGYTNVIGAEVSDFDVDDSRHIMRLVDAWTDKTGRADRVTPAKPKQDWEFRVNSVGYARNFGFTVLGEQGQPAYQLRVGADGALARYDTVARVWQPLTPANAAPQRKWHTIKVVATLEHAEVFLNGQSVGTVAPSTPGSTGLGGHSFTTTSAASQYDHFLIDDVEQDNPA